MSADVLFGQNVACVCVLSVLFAYTATQYHQDRRMRLLLVAMLLELDSAALLLAGRTYSQFGTSVVQVPAMTLCARVLCVGSTVVLATSFVLRRRDGRPDVAWGPLVATLAPAWTAGLWAAATRDEPPLSLCATVSVLLAFAVHFRAYEAELKRRAEAVDRMRSVALQEQMRPHFTFNAIAALRELCKTDPDKAAEGLDNLAGYLRANIDAISQTATVPFAQELSHVEQYVALEHLNPNSRFEIVYDLQVLDFHVPVLSVQPLVENAILHGVRSMGEDGMVILSTERHGNLIRITVEDNGPGVQDGATNRQMDHAGRGMENVRSRLESLCGGSLNVRSDGNGTRVTLIVPQKGGTMVTLSVDDNPTVARAVADILANVDPTGTHLVASSAAEALATAVDKPVQVAFLDVVMPDTDGLKLARLLRELRPETDIVFVTGYKEYAWRAFEVRASDYLLKPMTEEQIRRALVNLRHVSEGATEDNQLHIRCFGSFECLHKGTPVRFGRAKTKELLAYLVDRNGAICSTGELVTALWEKNTGSDASYANQLRVFISDLQTTLTRLGVGETLVRSRGQLSIDRNAVDCDYFAFLDGDPEARRSFRGEYMRQYSFGETTLAWLLRVSGNGIGQ